MDTTFPLLWKLRRERPDVRVSVLYCVPDRRQVLRDGTYFDRSFREWGIRQYDLGDFLKPSFTLGQAAWRQLFRVTPNDGFPMRTLKAHPSVYGLKSLIVGQPRLRKMLERSLGRRFIDADRILPELKPDVVLFDHRARIEFSGREEVFGYLATERPPVVLLPHAPHDIRPTSEFAPFAGGGDVFPDYCLYWIAFRAGTPHIMAPDRAHDFVNVGYPGLDSEWIRHIIGPRAAGPKPLDAELRCLVTTRNFYPKGIPRPESEQFVAAYDDVEDMLRRIAKATTATGRKVRLVIKPHPSASRPHLKDMIDRVGISSYEITYEPFYGILGNVDFVVSGFTTSLMLPLVYGIPTIILNSDIQGYVHEWDVLETLYRGCRYFVEDPRDLGGLVQSVVGQLALEPVGGENPDVAHVRHYFPDGAINKAVDLVMELAPNGVRARQRGR